MAVAAALLVVALGATLLAALVTDGGSSRSTVLSDWLTGAEEAGSYRFSLEQQVSGRGAPSGGRLFSLEGEVDVPRNLTRTVTRFEVLGATSTCTSITEGTDAIYVSVHESKRAALGAAWLRGDTEAAIAGFSFPIRPDRFDDDPDRFITDIGPAGAGQVDGTPTRTYAARLDLTALYPPTGGARPQAESSEVPLTLHVDEAGLLRRMEVSLTRTERTSVGLRVDFFDYGEPITLTAPDPAQVKPGRPDQIATACFPAS